MDTTILPARVAACGSSFGSEVERSSFGSLDSLGFLDVLDFLGFLDSWDFLRNLDSVKCFVHFEASKFRAIFLYLNHGQLGGPKFAYEQPFSPRCFNVSGVGSRPDKQQPQGPVRNLVSYFNSMAHTSPPVLVHMDANTGGTPRFVATERVRWVTELGLPAEETCRLEWSDVAPQDPQLAERLTDMGQVVQQLQGLGSDLVRATGEIRTQLEHCHGQTRTEGGTVNKCVKALDDHTTNFRQAATARKHLQPAGLALKSTVTQVKATLQAHQDRLGHAVGRFDEPGTKLESRVNSLDTALGGLRRRVEQVECTATANQRQVQQSLQEHMWEIAAMQHFLSTIRGVPEHLTDLQARVYTLKGPDARARVAPDPTADYKIRLQSVESTVAQLQRVPHTGHSTTLPTRGATVTPSKLLEAEGRMRAAAEHCVRQHYTMLHDRFTSLEQEVPRRIALGELAQAAWQAKLEVAPPPNQMTGSRYEPLEHRVCQLDSRVTGVQDALWQLQATVGGLVHLTRSPREPQASAAPMWGLGVPVDTAAPL